MMNQLKSIENMEDFTWHLQEKKHYSMPSYCLTVKLRFSKFFGHFPNSADIGDSSYSIVCLSDSFEKLPDLRKFLLEFKFF